MKECIKCNTIKELNEYPLSKNKHRNVCRTCINKQKNESALKLKENNPERYLEIKEYKKKWALDNKEVVLERSKKYYENNKEKVKENSKNWKINNRDKLLDNRKNKHKEKMETDILYKLNISIRSCINNSIKVNGFKKYYKSNDILGCTPIEFKEYLESKFEDWMTWDNYGLYEVGKINYGWDIDHIIPSSSAETEEQILNLNRYTNLQPLCSYTNRNIKRNII